MKKKKVKVKGLVLHFCLKNMCFVDHHLCYYIALVGLQILTIVN